MSTTASKLLDRLDGVKPSGESKWCPAHDDRSPSMAIRLDEWLVGWLSCRPHGAPGLHVSRSLRLRLRRMVISPRDAATSRWRP